MITVGADAAVLANEWNTGNGAVSGVTLGVGVQVGDYAIAFSAPTAYAVTAPDRTVVGSGVVGTPFDASGLSFTINTGTEAFAARDGFTVLVQPIATTQLNLSA